MKRRNEKCEECNGHISYDQSICEHRCDSCGVITDQEGNVIYDVQTMHDM